MFSWLHSTFRVNFCVSTMSSCFCSFTFFLKGVNALNEIRNMTMRLKWAKNWKAFLIGTLTVPSGYPHDRPALRANSFSWDDWLTDWLTAGSAGAVTSLREVGTIMWFLSKYVLLCMFPNHKIHHARLCFFKHVSKVIGAISLVVQNIYNM